MTQNTKRPLKPTMWGAIPAVSARRELAKALNMLPFSMEFTHSVLLRELDQIEAALRAAAKKQREGKK